MSKTKKPTAIPRLLVLLAVILVVVAFKVAGLFRPADITIGGKDFTEQSVLCEMMAILIEENTDLRVDRRPFLGGTMVCFNGLRGGELDAYAEYTGTGLVNILGRDAMSDPNETLSVVRQAFTEEYNLTWLEPFGFNNTYTLTMRREQAEELGIRTFSDLARHITSGNEPQLTAGFTFEFLDRPDGYRGLCEAYGFEFIDEPRGFDPGLMYKACADGELDVICAFATDGRIAAFDLVTLEDDRQFFPPYYAAPLIRNETLEAHPELRDLLNQLGGLIDDETMQQLNYQVDRKDNPRRARDVAREFLIEQGLIPSQQPQE
jgi:glycine betaine/choline ABC-type transport system substrate-binding protein